MRGGDERACKLVRELLRALGGSLVAVGATVALLVSRRPGSAADTYARALTRLSAAARLDGSARGPLRVRRTLSAARGASAVVLCQHTQKCLLLSRLRRGGDLIRFVQLSRGLSFRQSLACLDPWIDPEADSSAVFEQTFHPTLLLDEMAIVPGTVALAILSSVGEN